MLSECVVDPLEGYTPGGRGTFIVRPRHAAPRAVASTGQARHYCPPRSVAARVRDPLLHAPPFTTCPIGPRALGLASQPPRNPTREHSSTRAYSTARSSPDRSWRS